jgi:1,4-dihydroxy-2-naphthoate octaprenyltransferase
LIHYTEGFLVDTLKAFLTVSRANVQVVSFASATLGIFLGARSFEDVLSPDVLVFVILFYVIITFACNINCFFDVPVDRLRKRKLAEAVMYLGKTGILNLLLLEAIFAIMLSIFLIFRGHWIVAFLGLLGLYLGWIYSVPPLKLKGKGLMGPVPVILGVYVIPIIAGHLLVNRQLTFLFLAFVAGYAVMNLGINLVNTCEDFTEDRILGIGTVAHRLGLRKTLDIAFLSCLAGGGVALVCLLGWGYSRLIEPTQFMLVALILYLISIFTVSFTSYEIMNVGRANDLEGSAKKHAGKMPRWFVITRYPMWLFALTLLFI